MTIDERKRGLRAAVEAKRIAQGERNSFTYTTGLLWEIIDSLVEECEELRPLTIEGICSKVAEHYSRKFNGKVTCNYLGEDWQEPQGQFEIHGQNLPENPDLIGHYPNGWEMLDRITLEEALKIVRPADVEEK